MAHAKNNLSYEKLQEIEVKLIHQGYRKSQDWHGLRSREYAVRSHTPAGDMMSTELEYAINIED